jgi:hypothetical protein
MRHDLEIQPGDLIEIKSPLGRWEGPEMVVDTHHTQCRISGISLRYKKSWVCGLLLVTLVSEPAKAATTAETLLDSCASQVTCGYCEGYIAGFVDGRTTSDYGQSNLMSCPPTDPSGKHYEVSYTQMVRVFINWAEAHPELLHLHDWQAVREAFAQAWPCQ